MIIFFQLLMLKSFINLRNKSSSISNKNMRNNQSKIIKFIKRNLHKKYNNFINNIAYIKTLYIITNMRFGNYLVSLNNAIIFCEISGCKRIIINNDFIKHYIFYSKYNLTIEPKYSFNYIENDSMILSSGFFFSD